MDPLPSAPPVVVVVVTTDPGDWFEECLSSIAAQDYPNLSVLVVDTASTVDPTPRVAEVLPRAFVRRLPDRVQFGTAANQVLEVVDGASHYLFCHDDVALAPDAVRRLVEEAFRSNAGITTPKFVTWTDDERLLAIGMGADRYGTIVPLVEAGELDQGQHDSVRDVFVAPGGAALVRADLFAAVGGFRALTDYCGEDLDLSWRVRLAGGRVIAVPTARVSHLQARLLSLRSGTTDEALRQERHLADVHRVCTLLTSYRMWTLARFLPILLLTTLIDVGMLLFRGETVDAASAVSAPLRALRNPAQLLADRKSVQAKRRYRDAQIRRLQTASNARLRSLLRSGGARSAALAAIGADEVAAMAAGTDSPRAAAAAVPAQGSVDDLGEALASAFGDEPDAGRFGAASFHSGVRAEDDQAAGSNGRTARSGAPGLHSAAGRHGAAGAAGRHTARGGASGGTARGRAGGQLERAVGGLSRAGRRGLSAHGAHADGEGPLEEELPIKPTPWQWSVVFVGVIAAVFIIGGRSLFGHDLPAIGMTPQTSPGIGSWWHLWWTGWNPSGLGTTSTPSPALWLLSVAGVVLLGAVGTLQHILVLGPLVIGPWGAWRTARRLGSRLGGLAAILLYALCSIGFDSVARGRWEALVIYAAAPWLVFATARAAEIAPFTKVDDEGRLLAIARLGILTALVGAFAPSALVIVLPVVGLGLAGGLAITGERQRAGSLLVFAFAASLVGFVLLLPWSARVVTSASALFGVGAGPHGRLGLGQVIRFDTGPVGNSLLGWGLVVSAALPLVLGRSWRLAWAGRFWVLALWCWGIDWLALRGWLPFSIGDPDLLLPIAAAALAFSVALGVVAFETDLPGYRFGWRQLATGIAAVAILLGSLPAVGGATNGRWYMPNADAAHGLLLPDKGAGDFRVLWIGSPEAIPGGSWRLSDGVGYTLFTNGQASLADDWPPVANGHTGLVGRYVRMASSQETSQLGHILATMGVRYIIVPNHNAPSGSGGIATPVPNDVLSGLAMQTDLQLQNWDPSYTIYINSAWSPAVGLIGKGPASAARGATSGRSPLDPHGPVAVAQNTDLKGSPALPGALSHGAQHGKLPAGGNLYVAARDGWSLKVGGQTDKPAKAFGWATIFPTGSGGQASLSVDTPFWVIAMRFLEILLWLVAIGGVITVDARRRQARREEMLRAEEARAAKGKARPAPASRDEVWADA